MQDDRLNLTMGLIAIIQVVGGIFILDPEHSTLARVAGPLMILLGVLLAIGIIKIKENRNKKVFLVASVFVSTWLAVGGISTTMLYGYLPTMGNFPFILLFYILIPVMVALPISMGFWKKVKRY